MDVSYADASRRDEGILHGSVLDVAFGSDENNFTLTLDAEAAAKPREDGIVYVDGTEYGGLVDWSESDASKSEVRYGGRSWHGVLADKVLEPDPGADYLTASGEANAAILNLIGRMGLTDLFTASAKGSGVTVDHRFERYCTGYSGIRAMLRASGAKLKTAYDGAQKKVVLWAEPIADYSAGIDADASGRMAKLSIRVVRRPYNHLVCLGQGEKKDRIVIHLYADADGSISQTQTLFGEDERTTVYNYSNADAEELMEQGIEKLKELQEADTIEADLDEDGDVYDIDDIVSGVDPAKGVEATGSVSKKVVTISDGELTAGYEIGGAAQTTSLSGSSESSGGGRAYVAGKGITISGSTIAADVDSGDLDAVSGVAESARTEASNASALAAAAVKSVSASDPIEAQAQDGAVAISHKASGVSGGSYGPAADAEPSWGEAATVGPRLSIDGSGHVTFAAGRKVKMPSSPATHDAAGLMAPADKEKLDGIDEGANNYSLPIAEENVLGGIMPDGKTIVVGPDGTASAQQGEATSFLGAHPVGCVYEETAGESPEVTYGGTWRQLPSLGCYKWERTG